MSLAGGTDQGGALRAIAGLAFREVFRRRLVAAVAALTACFLALYGVALHFWTVAVPVGHHGGLLRGAAAAGLLMMGLYVGQLLSALLAVFAAAGAISGEVENGSMHSVLARPVRRGTVVLGKFAGFGAMVVLYAAVLNGAVMAIAAAVLGSPVPHVWAVLGLMCLEPLLLLALTLLGGTFLSTLANGAAVILLYGLGTVGGLVEQLGSLGGSAALVNIGIATSLVIPSDALYRKAAALVGRGAGPLAAQVVGPFGAGVDPSLAMVVYALLFTAAAVAVAAWHFGRRDV